MVAICPFLFPRSVLKDKVFPFPIEIGELNTSVCGHLSREAKGPLCGRCTGDTGPSIYSVGSECVPCSPVNVVYYILLQYLPTTLLFLLIPLFRVNITAAPMAHYVLLCNLPVFSCKFVPWLYPRLYYDANSQHITHLVKSLNAVWSLDACFSYLLLSVYQHTWKISSSHISSPLPLVTPFILLLMTYTAIELYARGFTPVVKFWRPFHRLYVSEHGNQMHP